MDYEKASQYWDEKDKNNVCLEKDRLLVRIEEFIKAHNTMALATGYDTFVRCTPLEYNFYEHAFYIFSEGGKKFVALEHNKNVSCAIFEPYQGFGKIHSLQITGTLEVIDSESEEFAWACKQKGLSMEALKKMNVSFHLLKIVPTCYDFLESSLKQEGYSNRQHYEF